MDGMVFAGCKIFMFDVRLGTVGLGTVARLDLGRLRWDGWTWDGRVETVALGRLDLGRSRWDGSILSEIEIERTCYCSFARQQDRNFITG